MNLYNKDLLLLSDFSYWQSKKLYTQLMEKFINGIIDGQKFEEEFYQIWISKNILYSKYKGFIDTILRYRRYQRSVRNQS